LLVIQAAWQAQRRIAELQRSDSRLLPVQLGIGINTGAALAGKVGPASRSECTVIGD